MDIRHTEYSRLFPVSYGGAGLNFDHPCGHGVPTISLHLFSEHGGTTEDIRVLLPTCAAPALFGAALAFVQAAVGAEAAEDFIAAMLAARDQGLKAIEGRKAQPRTRCEAGRHTEGREHTCTAATDSPS
ncbi:hypothetical protein AB0F46_35325 [Streptomyces sp. NPDC026665]|uniref:hypothetical protein n=1 Tax=Streptomyces sp. NPDC026665 TaxID=3154798 RepID=UPI0033FF2208